MADNGLGRHLDVILLTMPEKLQVIELVGNRPSQTTCSEGLVD